MVVTDIHRIACAVAEIVNDDADHLIVGPGMYPYPHVNCDPLVVNVVNVVTVNVVTVNVVIVIVAGVMAAGLGTDDFLSCHQSSPVIFGGRGRRPSSDRNADTEFAKLMQVAD